MNMLGCLDTPDARAVLAQRQEVSRLSDDELAAVRNREIGFVFQTFNLLPRMTALHNVELPLVYARLASRERRERAVEALARVGLGEPDATTARTSSRAASGSGWPSPGRWSTTPRSSWPTSRPATSTARPARRSCASSSDLNAAGPDRHHGHARARHRRARPALVTHPRRPGFARRAVERRRVAGRGAGGREPLRGFPPVVRDDHRATSCARSSPCSA